MVAPPSKAFFWHNPLPTGPVQPRRWFRARAFRRASARILVRAVRYRRGGLFLAALRWHTARDHADQREHDAQVIMLSALRLLAAGGEPADDLTPALPVLIARATLTAAPPSSRAPVPAGAPA